MIIFFIVELFFVFCKLSVFIRIFWLGIVDVSFFNLVSVVCVEGNFLRIFLDLMFGFDGMILMFYDCIV